MNSISVRHGMRAGRRQVRGIRALRDSTALALSLAGVASFASSNTALADSPILPTGGSVVVGSATISQTNSSTLNVTTGTNRTAINWQGFSIGTGGTVDIEQPGASSMTYNRVTGVDPSVIQGALRSNGQVVLANPNGIWFGKNSHVDVSSLLAATATASPAALAAYQQGGRLALDVPGLATSSIVNDGEITVADQGLAALVAPGVANRGTITANWGQVYLAGGNYVTLDFYGDGLISFAVSGTVSGGAKDIAGNKLGAVVSNSGRIAAAGGQVLLTAATAKAVVDDAINMSGVVQASAATQDGGDIVLDGGQSGTVAVSGTLDASAPQAKGGGISVTGQNIDVTQAAKLDASGVTGGKARVIAANATTVRGTILATGLGGSVETSGETLDIAGAKVSASNWLLDPVDLTINTGAASSIDTALQSGDVTIQTTATSATSTYGGTSNTSGSGDINVDAPISWSTNRTLSLSAFHSINVNSTISQSINAGSGGIVLQTDNNSGGTSSGGTLNFGTGGSISFPGTAGTLSINGDIYTLIRSESDLHSITASPSLHYALAKSFDISSDSLFTAIGYSSYSSGGPGSFTGTFEGLGNTISGLTINLTTSAANPDDLGLFAHIGTGGSVENLNLTNVSINASNTQGFGSSGIGTIAGENDGVIINSSVSGSIVNAVDSAGGLVGKNGNAGTISQSFSSVTVTGTQYVGGLAGTNSGLIINSYATGTVRYTASSGADAGGLVGDNSGSISQSYATGSVSGSSGAQYVGGLVGVNLSGGNIFDSYAIGSTIGGQDIGGLVGFNNSGATILDSYAKGAVSATASSQVNAGGLIGDNAGTINQSYATGSVSGSSGAQYVGGLVGSNDSSATILDSYAMGRVSAGGDKVGGFVGQNAGTISTSFSTGSVTSNSGFGVGGFVGSNSGTLLHDYWASATGQSLSSGAGSGATSITLGSLESSLANFSLSSSVWGNFSNTTTPYLLANGGPVYTVIGSTQTVVTAITSGFQLEHIGTTGEYWLASNLDLSNIPNFKPIGTFTGIFDGLGHTISNLTIDEPSAIEVGLFSQLGAEGTSGFIRNLGLIGGSVTGSIDVGELVGFVNRGSISQSYATGTVNGSQDVGGLVGANETGAKILDSYAMGAVSGGDTVGGLVGANDGGTISTSFSTGSVSGSTNVGGFVGSNSGSLSNDYWASATAQSITAGAGGGAISITLAGFEASSLSSGLGFNSSIWGNGGNTTTPYLLANNGPVYIAGNGTTLFTAITSGTQLESISTSGDYVLESGLDLSGFGDFTPIGFAGGTNTAPSAFSGVFNGLGNTIFGLTIVETGAKNVALFSAVDNGGIVQNIHLSGGTVDGGSDVGELVGVIGSINNGNATSGTVLNSSATGTVIGNPTVSTPGDNNGDNNYGGLVGYLAAGTISGSYATGSVTTSVGNAVGGLVGGVNTGSILSSYATGSVSGHKYVGGLVGNVVIGTISGSYATGNVTGSSDSVGGLVGQVSIGAILTSYATGIVHGATDIGGLVGYLGASGASTIDQSYATGSVSSSLGTAVGGLVGFENSGSKVTDSYAMGNVTGGSKIGGLVGSIHSSSLASSVSSIANSFSTGIVTGNSANALVGGLVGAEFDSSNSSYYLNSYWASATGQSIAAGAGVGGTSISMANFVASQPTGFLTSTWSTSNGQTTPTLVNNAGPFQAQGLGAQMFSGAITTISLFSQFANIESNKNYVLTGDITASGNSAPLAGGSSFTGLFLGGNHTITGLTISSSSGNLGLFSSIASGGAVANLNIVSGSVTGTGDDTGGLGILAGQNDGTISQVHVTGTVNGSGPGIQYVGGLVGFNDGTILNSSAIGSVSGANGVGGLVGYSNATATILQSYANATITASGAAGGLVGINLGSIAQSYAVGSISVSVSNGFAKLVGGFVGQNSGTVTDSYTTVGISVSGATIGDSYGGFVGSNLGHITDAYSTGAITGVGTAAPVGGFAGADSSDGLITNAYWDETTSGTSLDHAVSGASGLSGSSNYSTSSYSGFNFSSTWVIVDTDGSLNNASGNGAMHPILRSEYSSTITNSHQLALVNLSLGASYTLGNDIDLSSISTGDVWAGSLFPQIAGTFTGTFNGNDHTITGLSIAAGTASNVGLFGTIGNGGTVENLGLVGGSISGTGNNYGMLAGQNNGLISQVYATGSVSGSQYVGGLVGFNDGTIIDSYTTVSVSGTDSVGGFVGKNSGSISTSFSTGAVSGSTNVNGFIGSVAAGSSVASSYWDTTSSGFAAADPSGATGLTTAQLASTLPSGFSGSIWSVSPDNTHVIGLSWQASHLVASTGTYNSISGLVDTNLSSGTAIGSGAEVDLVIAGKIRAKGITGGDGTYLLSYNPGGVSVTSGVVVYAVSGGSPIGGTFDDVSLSSSMSGVNIYAGTLSLVTPNTGTVASVSSVLNALNNTLGNGNISPATIGLTSLSSSYIAVASGVGLDIAGPILLSSDVTVSAGLVSFEGSIEGAQALTVSGIVSNGILSGGNASFKGSVGDTTALTSLSVFGTTQFGTTAPVSIVTTGAQSYGGTVTLGSNATLTSTVGAITFGGTVNGTSDGAQALTVSGNAAYGGAVGGTTRLASLTDTGTTVLGGNVSTSGAQSYSGSLSLAASTTLAGSDLTFGSAINGAGHDLSLSASSAVLTLPSIGNVGALTVTDTVAPITLDGNVSTSGAQSYSGAVLLGTNTTLTGTTIGFVGTGSTIDGAHALTVSGNGLFGGIVGGTTALTSLSVSGATQFGTTAPVSIVTTGAQNYGGTVTLNNDATLTANTGAVTFAQTVNGGHSLTVHAASSTVTFGGAVGGATSLSSLTATGGSITLGGNVSTTGAQSYSGAVTLGSNVTLDSSAGNGSIALGTVDDTTAGAHALSLTTGTGAVTLGVVGGTKTLSSLSVTGSSISAVSVATTGNQSYSGATTLNGTYSANGFSITGANATVLGGATTIDAGALGTSFGGTVNGTSDGAQALTVSGTAAYGGAVGGTTRLASLTDTGTTVLGGNVSTSGAQSYSGAVSLAASTTLAGSGLTFGSAINGGAFNLSLSASSSALTLPSISTTGTLTITDSGAVTQAVGSSVNLNALDLLGTGGTYTLTNTDNNIGMLTTNTGSVNLNNGGNALTLRDVTLSSGGLALSNLGVLTLLGNVTVRGQTGIDFTGATSVVIGANTTLDTSGSGGTISLGTVNDATADAHTLSLNAGNGTIALNGVIGGTPLAGLSVTGGLIELNGGSVTTSLTQSYSGAVTLGADTTLTSTAGAIDFGSTIDSAADSAHSLAASGYTGVSFGNAVGGTSKLSSLSAAAAGTGATIALNTVVITSGAQSYSGAVTLGSNVTLDSSVGNGSIALGTVDDTTAGAHALSLTTGTGAVTLGVVGGTKTLSSLSVTGSSISAVSVATTGNQSYSGATTLNGTYSANGFSITGANATVLGGATTIDAGASGTSFGGTVNGAQALTISDSTGAVSFGGVVGGATSLSSLTVTGSSISAVSVATTGNQSYSGATTLNGTYSANGFSITGANATVLGGATTIDAGASGTSFGGTVNGTSDGAQALTVSGNAAYGGAVGGTTRLASLTDTGTTVLGGNVSTSGAQSYSGAVTLGADAILTSTVGGISFGSTIDGAHALSLVGNGLFGGIVGGTTALSSLSVSGTTALDTTAITTSGAQTYTGAMTLDPNATLDSSAGNGDISLGAVDDTTAGADMLTVKAGTGNVTAGVIGGTTELAAFSASGNTVTVAGVHTLDDQTYTAGAVSLTGSAALTATNSGATIAFNTDNLATPAVISASNVTVDTQVTGGTIDIGATTTGALNISATLLQTLAAGTSSSVTIGDTHATVNIANVTKPGNVLLVSQNLMATNVTLDGNGITATNFLANNVTLIATSFIDTTQDNGTITINGTVNGAFGLTLNAGTGTVTVSGNIGNTTPLTSLKITGDTVSLASVDTTGALALSANALTVSGSVIAPSVTLGTQAGGGTISLGSGTNGLVVSQQLANILGAAAPLTIGDANSVVSVDGALTLPGGITLRGASVGLGSTANLSVGGTIAFAANALTVASGAAAVSTATGIAITTAVPNTMTSSSATIGIGTAGTLSLSASTLNTLRSGSAAGATITIGDQYTPVTLAAVLPVNIAVNGSTITVPGTLTAPLQISGTFTTASGFTSLDDLILTGATTISGGSGAINLKGVSWNNPTTLLTLTASSATIVDSAPLVLGTTTASGNLTIDDNAVSLGTGATVGVAGYLTLDTFANGGSIGLGNSAGMLNLSAGLLGTLGANNDLVIGDGTNAITIFGAIGTTDALIFNGNLILAADTAITSSTRGLVFEGMINPVNNTTTLTLSAGGDIYFGGSVGTTSLRLHQLTIAQANNVTVANQGNLIQDPFTGQFSAVNAQLLVDGFASAIAGTLSVGQHSLESDGDVSIIATTVDGRIVAGTGSDNTLSIQAGSVQNVTASGNNIVIAANDVTNLNIGTAGDNAVRGANSVTITAGSITGSTVNTGVASITSTNSITNTTVVATNSLTVSAASTGNDSFTAPIQNTHIIGAHNGVTLNGVPVTDATVQLADLTVPQNASNPHVNHASQSSLDSDDSGDTGSGDSGDGSGKKDKSGKNGKNKKGAETAADKGTHAKTYDYANQYVDKLLSGHKTETP